MKYDLSDHKEVLNELHKAAQKFLPDEEFNNLLKGEANYITTLFKKEKKDGFEPMLVTVGKKEEDGHRDKNVVMMLVDDFDKNRYKYFYNIGAKFADENKSVSAAFFMSEAWMKQFDLKDAEAYQHGDLAKYADKKEVIIIGGMTIDVRFNSAMFDITRDKDKNISVSEPTFIFAGKDAAMQSDLLMEFYKGYSNIHVMKMMGLMNQMKKSEAEGKPAN